MTEHHLFMTLEHAFLMLLALFHAAGAVSAVNALFSTRSSQGAIAWVLSMLVFPVRGRAPVLDFRARPLSRLRHGPARGLKRDRSPAP